MSTLPKTIESQKNPLRQKQPFIVDAPAKMLKRNLDLSRNARTLYMTLRCLANGRTGELKIPGRKWGQSEDRWLKATAFDRAAEMCRCVRLKAMRELLDAGLVTIERESVLRIIKGRRRVVWAGAHYTVHKQPVIARTIKKPRILPKSISSTVEEIDSQYLSNPPVGAGLVLPCSESLSPLPSDCHHQSTHEQRLDEDDSPTSLPEKATPKIKTNGKSPVDETIKNLSPELRSWMDTRILARAQSPVKNRSAFLRASRPAFIESMVEEVELYLQEKTEEFMRRRLEETEVVDFDETYDFLKAETEKHELPVGEDGDESEYPFDVFGRIYDNAAEVLGLKSADEGDARVECPKCGASVLESARATHAKLCRQTETSLTSGKESHHD